jgi:hypothetical protein
MVMSIIKLVSALKAYRGLFRYGEKSNDLRNCQGGNKFIELIMEIRLSKGNRTDNTHCDPWT